MSVKIYEKHKFLGEFPTFHLIIRKSKFSLTFKNCNALFSGEIIPANKIFFKILFNNTKFVRFHKHKVKFGFVSLTFWKNVLRFRGNERTHTLSSSVVNNIQCLFVIYADSAHELLFTLWTENTQWEKLNNNTSF